MIFEQHLAAFRQLACAIYIEIGTKLRTEFVRTVPGAESFPHAIRSDPGNLRIGNVIADRIHQTIEILVSH